MAVNTLTEIVNAETEIEVKDGFLHCSVLNGSDSARIVLEGFRLHMEQLQEEYPRAIKITTEV